jgi:hypothetical protein
MPNPAAMAVWEAAGRPAASLAVAPPLPVPMSAGVTGSAGVALPVPTVIAPSITPPLQGFIDSQGPPGAGGLGSCSNPGQYQCLGNQPVVCDAHSELRI